MSLVARARIAGAVSQQVFDVLLRTLAEPGTIEHLPIEELPTEIPRPLWLALALADVDLGVNVDDDPTSEWASLVRDATGANTTRVEDSWIVTLSAPTADLMRRIPTGTALAPEHGARVALGVTDLGEGLAEATRLELSGPGVPGTRLLDVQGLDGEVIDLLALGADMFPAGFDTWLFTPEGRVAAIPRSTHVTPRRP